MCGCVCVCLCACVCIYWCVWLCRAVRAQRWRTHTQHGDPEDIWRMQSQGPGQAGSLLPQALHQCTHTYIMQFWFTLSHTHTHTHKRPHTNTPLLLTKSTEGGEEVRVRQTCHTGVGDIAMLLLWLCLSQRLWASMDTSQTLGLSGGQIRFLSV